MTIPIPWGGPGSGHIRAQNPGGPARCSPDFLETRDSVQACHLQHAWRKSDVSQRPGNARILQLTGAISAAIRGAFQLKRCGDASLLLLFQLSPPGSSCKCSGFRLKKTAGSAPSTVLGSRHSWTGFAGIASPRTPRDPRFPLQLTGANYAAIRGASQLERCEIASLLLLFQLSPPGSSCKCSGFRLGNPGFPGNPGFRKSMPFATCMAQK